MLQWTVSRPTSNSRFIHEHQGVSQVYNVKIFQKPNDLMHRLGDTLNTCFQILLNITPFPQQPSGCDTVKRIYDRKFNVGLIQKASL
jgi:hypothetical protein